VNGVELQIFADVLARQPTNQQLADYYGKHQTNTCATGSCSFAI